MKKPSAKLFRMAPLQRLAVRPLEDPAEQAALDELLKRSEQAASDVSSADRGSRAARGDAGKRGTGTS
jgi:hypothetical protein